MNLEKSQDWLFGFGPLGQVTEVHILHTKADLASR